MAMGFGLCVGDPIAAIDLVATVVDTLCDSGNSSLEYRGFVRQLNSVQGALRIIKILELYGSKCAEAMALQKAASQGQVMIDESWKKISNSRPHLRNGGSTSELKDSWMKFVLATCMSDDVAKFKAHLDGHAASIQLFIN